MRYKLGDLTKIYTGKLNANAATPDGKYPFFTCSKEVSRINTYSYDCECILVAGNGDLNVKYFHGKFNAYQRTYIIENKRNEIIYMPYLYYFMSYYIDKLRNQTIGGVIKYIKLSNLTDIVIELPTMDVQRKIVEKLKKLRRIRLNKEDELIKLDSLVKARFVEMFGTTNDNIFNYPVVRLGECVSLQGGYAFKSKDFVDNGIKLVQIGNVNKDYLDWKTVNRVPKDFVNVYKDFQLKENDLLIALTRPIIKSIYSVKLAKVSKSDLPCLLNQRVGRFIILKRLNPYFLEQLCKMDDFRYYVEQMSSNSLQPNISGKQVEEYKIILPPIELQNEFASFVQQVDKSKVAIQKSLDETQILFDSLMQKYFS